LLVLIECVVLDVLPLPKSVSATNGLAALPPQEIDTAPLVPPDAIGVIVIWFVSPEVPALLVAATS
jgi:hypothetical protein